MLARECSLEDCSMQQDLQPILGTSTREHRLFFLLRTKHDLFLHKKSPIVESHNKQ